MKGLILVIIIFLIFAVIGFQIANSLDQSSIVGQKNESIPTSGTQVQQHNLIVVHVDRLESQEPRLMSVWFVSLFLVDGSPPVLTIAPIYPAHSDARNRVIDKAFSLAPDRTPSLAFWKVISSMKFKWEAFLVVDDFTVQKVMEWTNGPGNFPQLLENAQDDPGQSQQVLTQTCQAIGASTNREDAPFEWKDLVPAHFHSNLRMELALSYWNDLTTSVLPIDCVVLMK
jgi:hypothetical protein